MTLYAHRPVSHRFLTCYMVDVSNAVETYVPVPWKCKLLKLGIIIGNAITVADSIVTCSTVGAAGTAAVTTAITGGAITVTNVGSAQGNEYTATPTAVTRLVEGSSIKFVSGGQSTGVAPSTCYAIVDLMDN